MQDNNERKTNGLLLKILPAAVIVTGSLIFVIVLGLKITKETEILLSASSMFVRGMYGVTYGYDEISSVELKNTMPAVTYKSNGADWGDAKKGNFDVEGLGKCKLFILSKDGPFLFVKAGNQYVIINYKDKTKTEKLYKDLLSKLGM